MRLGYPFVCFVVALLICLERFLGRLRRLLRIFGAPNPPLFPGYSAYLPAILAQKTFFRAHRNTLTHSSAPPPGFAGLWARDRLRSPWICAFLWPFLCLKMPRRSLSVLSFPFQIPLYFRARSAYAGQNRAFFLTNSSTPHTQANS